MTEPFAGYRGTAYYDKIDDDQRAGLSAWEEILRLGQGNLVDGAYFIDSQIYLCPETADYIYSAFTPTTVSYGRGSRPFLDKVVEGLGLAGLPDFRKFLWLMRFVRDLHSTRGWTPDIFSGGTEEDLIQKRALICNEKARLMVALCQVAGLPARYVGHHIGGHGVTEVCIDGHWAYGDVQAGKFFLKPDGQLASTWEIWRDPKIIRRQPEWVQNEIHPMAVKADPYLITESAYFNAKECTGVVNYFVADHPKFDYTWTATANPDFDRQIAPLAERRNRARRKLGMHGIDY
jgi:hypothetical protein